MEGTHARRVVPHERRSGACGEALWTPVGDRRYGGSCNGAFSLDEASAQGRPFELDPVSAMKDAIEDRVDQGGIPKHRKLPPSLMGWCLTSR